MIFARKEYKIKTWKYEKLTSVVAVDTETEFKPFYTTPRLVTTQAYDGGDTVYYIPKEALKIFFTMHQDTTFIMHNAAFDLDVLSRELGNKDFSYDLLDRGKVHDTSILYRLLHLAVVGFVPHKYNLNMLSQKYLGESLDKTSGVRTSFEQFMDKPISDIPKEYLEYGAGDVIATLGVYWEVLTQIQQYDTKQTLLSHNVQIKGDLALMHTHKNGIAFNLKDRDEWLIKTDEAMRIQSEILATWGWCRGVKGINDRYESIVTMLGLAEKLPKTKAGSISSASSDLASYRYIPFINAYISYHELEKMSSFVRKIESSRIHPRYNLLMNTGRTSCTSPNFQQLPRGGGIREMFIAEPGHTLLITDYSTLELCTLAQVCLSRYGESVMADKINEGVDLHKYYAATMRGVKEEEVTKGWRQEAKAANFGFPGGLGVNTFIEFSAGYGLELTIPQATGMRKAWMSAFPEMTPYLDGEAGRVTTLTGRLRGNTTYCAEKNTPFQGLAADGAKLALYNLDKAGFKIVGFVHDEIITEVKIEDAEELLKKQELSMVNSMKAVVPDVRISVDSQISEVYTK